ncbi:MAG: ribonuclease III [Proteobacteria bacterium]|nr:ribonuclease III [Cystobacterineae bacterium]MCL2258359.1 ribonuclease III [Cystobacterineae bacterium]MCL2315278.1 ribonuclease III [Pseudomonadota bacterium]
MNYLKKRIACLEQQLQVEFSSFELAKQALTHKSYSNERRREALSNNERLEFLGDAVLDLVIRHRLMEMLPLAREGELSKLRSILASEEVLANVARRIELGDLLLLGKGEDLSRGREKNSVLADALEAVLGAVYLSVDWNCVAGVVNKLFEPEFQAVVGGQMNFDYKTRLQETATKLFREAPHYRLISENGPSHEKRFFIEVFLERGTLAYAQGRSKKEAEQQAAKAALEKLIEAKLNQAEPASTGDILAQHEGWDGR